MIPGIVASSLIGGGGGGSLRDLILEDLAAAGQGYYFPHGEPSGLVMENEFGADGSYVPTVTLAQSPLYAGGGTSVRIPASGGGGYGRKSGGTLPSLTQLSILTVASFTNLSGLHGLISNDDGGSARGWQWRTNGAGMDWVKIIGGVETKSVGSGLSVGPTHLVGVDISDSGTPGTSNILLIINGSVVLSTTIGTVDYSGVLEALEIGYAQGGGGLLANALFVDSALIAKSIGSSRWAEYAAAIGV